ncbi:hypothetical protein OAQ87_01430 [Candidatus Marinimicrobia bacterium]|nr:hypothetical protein [Candidatus Neomarinimicrobiota bacterium]
MSQIYINYKKDNTKINHEVRDLLINSGIVNDCKNYINLTYEDISKSLIDLDIKKGNLHTFINKVRNRKF